MRGAALRLQSKRQRPPKTPGATLGSMLTECDMTRSLGCSGDFGWPRAHQVGASFPAARGRPCRGSTGTSLALGSRRQSQAAGSPGAGHPQEAGPHPRRAATRRPCLGSGAEGLAVPPPTTEPLAAALPTSCGGSHMAFCMTPAPARQAARRDSLGHLLPTSAFLWPLQVGDSTLWSPVPVASVHSRDLSEVTLHPDLP